MTNCYPRIEGTRAVKRERAEVSRGVSRTQRSSFERESPIVRQRIKGVKEGYFRITPKNFLSLFLLKSESF